MRQEQGTQLGASLLRSLVERSECPLIRGVHTRVVLDQQSRNIHVLRRKQAAALQQSHSFLSVQTGQLHTRKQRLYMTWYDKTMVTFFLPDSNIKQ